MPSTFSEGRAAELPLERPGEGYLRFTNWLTELDQLSGPIAAIWYEEVRRHVGTDAAHVYGGLIATLPPGPNSVAYLIRVSRSGP